MRILSAILLFSVLAVFSAFTLPVFGQDTDSPPEAGSPPVDRQPIPEGISEHFHFVPMRDGVRLWTSVRRPAGPHEPLPTILIRTPYDFGVETRRTYGAHFLNAGYALVVQNERGRHWSEGEFSIIANGAEDGYDTVDWIVSQPWSNGKVGTIGCSSSGDSQIPLAIADHPAHAAAITMASGSSLGVAGAFHDQGLFYRGGVVQIPWAQWYAAAGQRFFPKFPDNADAEARLWLAETYLDVYERGRIEFDLEAFVNTLPVMDMVRSTGAAPTDFDDFIRRFPNDPQWTEESFYFEGDPFGVPALWMFQLHDIGLDQNMANFEHVIGREGEPGVDSNQKVIVSPLGHCSNLLNLDSEHTIDGERPIGDTRFDYVGVNTEWFDYWLKGENNGALQRPRAEVYIPGLNAWRQFEHWPLQDTRKVDYFLGSEGTANSRGRSDGRLLPQPQVQEVTNSYLYDPFNPVPTVGGDAFDTPGSFDYSKLQDREDILVYTSEPLAEELTVLGYAEVILYVSSDAPDTDFAVKIFDVYPDGRAFNLRDSIQRARWRDGYDEPRFMKNGEVYEVRVGPTFVSNQFKRGHRVRLEVTSSNFPRFTRNLNTGGNNFDEKEGRTALNSVHISEQHASRMVLPVVGLDD